MPPNSRNDRGVNESRPIAALAYDGWSIGFWQRWRPLAYALRIDRWITVREKEPLEIKNAKTRQWIVRELTERAESAVGRPRCRCAPSARLNSSTRSSRRTSR